MRKTLPALALLLIVAATSRGQEGTPAPPTDLAAELARLRADLEETRDMAASAAEREAEAAELLEALEARLAELEAEEATAAAQAATARRAAAARPEPAEGSVRFLDGTAMILTANSNLRAGPGLNQPVRVVLPQGTRVRAYGEAGDWTRIRVMDGRTGWVYTGLLEAAAD